MTSPSGAAALRVPWANAATHTLPEVTRNQPRTPDRPTVRAHMVPTAARGEASG